jgi:hypothetical protein
MQLFVQQISEEQQKKTNSDRVSEASLHASNPMFQFPTARGDSGNKRKSINPAQLHDAFPEPEASFNFRMRAAIPSPLILKTLGKLVGGGRGLSFMYLVEYSSSCLLNPMLGQTIPRMD